MERPRARKRAPSVTRSATVDEFTIIELAVWCLPTTVVVLVLLKLLVEEYVRLMEMAGMIRKPVADEQKTEDKDKASS